MLSTVFDGTQNCLGCAELRIEPDACLLLMPEQDLRWALTNYYAAQEGRVVTLQTEGMTLQGGLRTELAADGRSWWVVPDRADSVGKLAELME